MHSLFINNDDLNRIEKEFGIINLIITILYPILDLSLIIPSVIILVNLYHDYQHSIPWILSSLSLLINAIADNGYVDDFIRGSSTFGSGIYFILMTLYLWLLHCIGLIDFISLIR